MSKSIKEFLLFIILIITGGVFSICLGKATNEFDVSNYHFYSPYAFLNNRLNIDILPGGIRSYFNPILDIPAYLMFKHLNDYGALVVFLQGTYWGMLIFSVYKLSSLVSKDFKYSRLFDIITCLLVAGAGVITFEAGSFFNDIQIAFLLLTGLYLYLKHLFNSDSPQRSCFIFCGVTIFGIVSGLKLTTSLLVFGIVVTSFVMIKQIDKPFKVILLSSLAFLFGFISVNGYWYYLIFKQFNNPFFPYFDNIFHSPLGNGHFVLNESYDRVLPKTLIDKWIYPFKFLTYTKDEGFGSWLFGYVDWRYPLIFISTISLSLFYVFSYFKSKKVYNKNHNIIVFFLITLVVSYVLWLNISPIARYIIPLIAIGCLLFNYGLMIISQHRSFSVYLILSMSVLFLLFITTTVDYKKIREPIGDKFITAEKYLIPDGAVVVLASQATSISTLNLNPKASFVYFVYPLAYRLETTHCQSYPSRNIDYYHSPYYEDLLKQKLYKNKNLYVIFRKALIKCESMLYEEAFKYYTQYDTILIENCQDMGTGENVMCKVVTKS